MTTWWKRLWGPGAGPPQAAQPGRRPGPRLAGEQLEGRTVPASFTAATVSELIAGINTANTAGGSNTITLVAGTTFTLIAVHNICGSGASQIPFRGLER